MYSPPALPSYAPASPAASAAHNDGSAEPGKCDGLSSLSIVEPECDSCNTGTKSQNCEGPRSAKKPADADEQDQHDAEGEPRGWTGLHLIGSFLPPEDQTYDGTSDQRRKGNESS